MEHIWEVHSQYHLKCFSHCLQCLSLEPQIHTIYCGRSLEHHRLYFWMPFKYFWSFSRNASDIAIYIFCNDSNYQDIHIHCMFSLWQYGMLVSITERLGCRGGDLSQMTVWFLGPYAHLGGVCKQQKQGFEGPGFFSLDLCFGLLFWLVGYPYCLQSLPVDAACMEIRMGLHRLGFEHQKPHVWYTGVYNKSLSFPRIYSDPSSFE